jgi:hypothetical protein
MKQFFGAFALAALSSVSAAAPPAGVVKAEIEALLSKLQASGCQFNRNGTWYTGSEAKDHLARKLEHLESKASVSSTEQFIDLAASRSSSSGQAYLVQCAGGVPVESKQWLGSQLASIRSSAGKVKP